MLTLRKLVSLALVLLVPASMFAADSAAAMLYTNGAAWLNSVTVPKASAIFVGDLVQTRTDSVANIKAPGTSVMVASDSLVQLKDNAIKLEHGALSVGTSKNLAAQVGGLKIAPASSAWTEFQVTDTDGTVKIIAKKGDLTLSDGTTLPQGQQTTRDETDENNKKKRKGGGAAPAAGGGILNSPVAIGVGSFVIGGLTAWVLVQGDDPLSPSSPR